MANLIDELLKKQIAAYLVENPAEMVVRVSDIKAMSDTGKEEDRESKRRYEWHYEFWE